MKTNDIESGYEPGKVYFEHLLKGDAAAALALKKEVLTKAKFLYRYRPLSGYGLEELITGQAYMARPDQLNDPYECRLLINVTGKYKIRLGSAWSAWHYFEKQLHCTALCEDPRLVLMWAHYANRENRFINLPIPSRIILLGDKLDAGLERMLRGISRLSSVPLALAELTPDAETKGQLEIRDL
ncbi:MAG: hypothetical protein ABSE59_08220 [Opitutaceae bacterium]